MSSSPPVHPTREWIISLPKIELHAHLSGSVREELVLELLKEEEKRRIQSIEQQNGNAPSANSSVPPVSSELRTFQFGDRNLSECFQVFKILHRLLSDLSILQRITREVIKDFAAENTVYLELRTTPRVLGSSCTKKDYVRTVVETMKECEQTMRTQSGERICARLILSIDRSQSMQEAEATLELAKEFSRPGPNGETPYIVGLDFSGNPTISTFRTFLPIFQSARAAGLKCSVHIGEKCDDGSDLDCALFEFTPERIGHVVCLEERHTEFLLKHPIPIEICPTSNLKTKIVQELHQHPFGRWRTQATERKIQHRHLHVESKDEKHHYPMTICTDDSGVFNITLTSELQRMSETFQLDEDELFRLQQRSVEYTFLPEQQKAQLRSIFERFAYKSNEAALYGSNENLNSSPSSAAVSSIIHSAAASSTPVMLHFHVTGFGEFHGVKRNPTTELMETLPTYLSHHPLPNNICLESFNVLETSGVGSRESFLNLPNKCPAVSPADGMRHEQIYLHFGVAAGTRSFKLESTAYNVADFRVPDQRQWQPRGEEIVAGQPQELRTSLDVNTMIAELQQAEGGFPPQPPQPVPTSAGATAGVASPTSPPSTNMTGWHCGVSTDPGRFVCNWIFYNSLHRAAQEGAKSLFVHVPTHAVYNLPAQQKFAREVIIAVAREVQRQHATEAAARS